MIEIVKLSKKKVGVGCMVGLPRLRFVPLITENQSTSACGNGKMGCC